MGTSYGSVRFAGAESLLFYLDAKLEESYPGSGDTWYDLSGNARHGIKAGSQKPEWNSDGYFIFTGGTTGNNYTRFDIPVPNITTGMSFFLTFRSSQSSSRIARMSSDDFNLTISGNNVYGGAGDSYLDAYAVYNTNGDRNVGWHYLGITFDNKITKLYYDGIYRSRAVYIWSDQTSITGGSLRLGTRNDTHAEHYIGDISAIHLHDRVLSSDEILQNYLRFQSGGHL